MIVGNRIRARRLDLDLSTSAASRLAGLDLSHWQRIERGLGNPTLSTLLRISHTLETTIGALTDGLTACDIPGTDLRPLTRSELDAAIRRL